MKLNLLRQATALGGLHALVGSDDVNNEGISNMQLRMLTTFIACFGLAISGIASAEQMTRAELANRPKAQIKVFSFEGLTWRMPEQFFKGIRPFTNNSQYLMIQFAWDKSTGTFISSWAHAQDVKLDIQVRNHQVEDPQNGLETIRRAKLPFEKVPLFSAAKFDGMTYQGSSSGIHYFVLDHEDAYVSCWLMIADRLAPPKVAPDVLSKKFNCDTTVRFPNGTGAWISTFWVDLNDVGSAFISARREVRSFVR